MPGNNMADDPELGEKGTSHCPLSSPLSKKINPNFEMRAQTDSYDEDESDSPSDDESSFSPESSDAVPSESNGSERLEKSNITSSLQVMSLGPKKLEDSKAWAGSSSDSCYPSTSDEENYSEDDLAEEDFSDDDSDDDNDRNPLMDIVNDLKKLELDADSKTRASQNDSNNKELDKESDDSEDQFDARGAEHLKKERPDTRPYPKEKPKNVYHTVDTVAAAILAKFPNVNDVLDEFDSSKRNLADGSPIHQGFEFNTELNIPVINFPDDSLTGSPQSLTYPEYELYADLNAPVMNCFNESPTASPQSPIHQQCTSLSPYFDIPAAGPPQTMSLTVPPPLASGSSVYWSDGNAPSVSPIDPLFDFDDFFPDISTCADSSSEFSQVVPMMIQPGMSPDSTSNSSDSNDRVSLLSYNSRISQRIENNINSNFPYLTADNELHSDTLFGNSESQQSAAAAQHWGTLSNSQYSPNVSTTTQTNLNDIPINIGQDVLYNWPGEQTATQLGAGLDEMTPALFSLSPTALIQRQNNVPQTIGNINAAQYNPPATQTQSPTRGSSSGGIVIVTPQNADEQVTTSYGRNSADIMIQNQKLDNYNIGQIPNTTSNVNHQTNGLLNIRAHTPTASMNTAQIPTTVLEHSSHRRRKHLRLIAPWPLLDQSSMDGKLRENIDDEVLQRTMVNMLQFKLKDYAEQRNGDTPLMAILRDQKRLKSHLAKFVILLNKMARIPESFTLTNNGDDALYLAAINCPELDYVVASLLNVIAKSSAAGITWRRKYGTKGDTLIHAVAAKGETHTAVLQVLLASGKFDLSAKNNEGKTPLHVAVEAHNAGSGITSVTTVQMLFKYGANLTIQSNSGDTPLHMAMSKKHCQGLVQALLYNGNGKEAVNIRNNAGNTPLHLAVALLNNAHQGTQEKICSFLIVNGARIDITNRQNKTPLGLVAEKRREVIGMILHRKLSTV